MWSSFSRAGLAMDAAGSGMNGQGQDGLLSVSPRLRADERRCEFVSPAFSRQRRLGREIVRRMSVWQNRATGFGALAGCQIPSVAVIRPENKAPEIVSFRDVADSDSNPWR